MKRSEVIEHIKEELQEILDNYDICDMTEKRHQHWMNNNAERILCFLEGFGMLPPGDTYTVHGVTTHLNNKWEDE